MAESLPRYRSRALLGDVPRLDFAAGREQVRLQSQFTETLNRMSQFAFGVAEEEAREKGLQYGAENPVTAEQIREASASGRDPETLFQGKRGVFGRTVFGEAARAAQVASVASEIQAEAQSKMGALIVGVERGEVDLDAARNDIQSMLDGYSNALIKVDPKTSIRLRAALATDANSTFLKITQTYFKKQDELRKVGVDAWLNNVLPGMIQAHIEAGATLDPGGGKITPQQRIDTLKPILMNQLAQIGDDTYARQAMDKFDKTVSRARVNAVSSFVSQDEFMRDPSGALTRIRAGNLGSMSDLYKSMPAEEQEAVRKNFMEEAGRIHTLTERAVKDSEDKAKNDVFDLAAKYWLMPDGPARDVVRNKIIEAGRGVMSFDQLHSLMRATDEKENVPLEIEAQRLIRRTGVTDISEIQRRVPGLQPKQLRRLQDMILDAGDRRLREGIRTMAGIPDGLVQMTGDQQRRFQALTEEAERLKSEAIAKTGAYDPTIVLGELRGAKERITADKAVDDAKAALEGYGAQKGVKLDENTSEKELARMKFTAPEIREIERRQRTILGDR